MLIAALVLTVAAYAPALTAPYIFDDATSIVHNPTIASLSSRALDPPPESPVAGRPVANYSLALSAAIDRVVNPNPGDALPTLGFHLINVVLHLLSGLILFGVVRRTVELSAGWAQDRSRVIAAVIAAIWLLHPIQTEAVDYLTQRTELLSSFFFLLTLYSAIRSWNVASTRRYWWYAAAVAASLLGAGSKEVILGAPFVVLLYDITFHRRSDGGPEWPALRRRAPFYLALMAISAALLLMERQIERSAVTINGAITPLAYLTAQGWAIWHYVRQIFLPFGFTIDYGQDPAVASNGTAGVIALAFLAIASLVLIVRSPRWRWLGFLGAAFLIVLAPSSSVVPVQTEIAAERRVYLASAAIIAMIVIGVAMGLGEETEEREERKERKERKERLAGVVLAVVLMALAFLTWRRSGEFGAPATLWAHATERVPGNARAWNNYGLALVDEGRSDAAQPIFERAVQVDSSYAPALVNAAQGAIAAGKYADAEALLRNVVGRSTRDGPAMVQLAGLLLLRGVADTAADLAQRAVILDPSNAAAHAALGASLAALGKTLDAVREFEEALRLDPGNGAARAALQRLREKR